MSHNVLSDEHAEKAALSVGIVIIPCGVILNLQPDMGPVSYSATHIIHLNEIGSNLATPVEFACSPEYLNCIPCKPDRKP